MNERRQVLTQIIEQMEALTVLELLELLRTMRERWGEEAPGEGAGTREPRRPLTPSLSGAMALDFTATTNCADATSTTMVTPIDQDSIRYAS